MAINLEKMTTGQKIDLTKGNEGLKNVRFDLGWNPRKSGQAFDLDSSAILRGIDGKGRGADKLIYFGTKPKTKIHGVQHSGDNLTGVGEGADESISVTLAEIPTDVERVSIFITIYKAEDRKQTFGQVDDAWIKIFNADTNEQLGFYDLDEDYSGDTAVHVGDLYRHNGEFKFQAVGKGLGKNYEINNLVADYVIV